MKTQHKKNIMIFTIAFFIVALILTIFPPFGSRVVAEFNNNYGTFDMQKYSKDIFEMVMGQTTDFSIYWKYYIMDYLFIVAFGNFNIQLIRNFKISKLIYVKRIGYIFAVIRGLLDAIENGMLLYLIYHNTKVNLNLVGVSNIITRTKFIMMRGWIICFVILLISSFYYKNKK